MEKSHIRSWFSEFPKLRTLLNEDEKKILDGIDPLDYKYCNLTREEEVIRIIEDHKPQAWKWIRLFPALRNLSNKDYVILDHIVPTDYIGDITEADVRRIIEYRKQQIKEKEEKEKDLEAKRYYEDHKGEIRSEEKLRSTLTKIVKYSSLVGVSFLTSGIVLKSIAHAAFGMTLITIPLLATSLKLKQLDKNSVIPRSPKQDRDRMDFLTVAFIILYYIGFIGMGITIGTLPIWDVAGWETAEPVMFVGLSTIVISVMLFLALAIATPSKE